MSEIHGRTEYITVFAVYIQYYYQSEGFQVSRPMGCRPDSTVPYELAILPSRDAQLVFFYTTYIFHCQLSPSLKSRLNSGHPGNPCHCIQANLATLPLHYLYVPRRASVPSQFRLLAGPWNSCVPGGATERGCGLNNGTSGFKLRNRQSSNARVTSPSTELVSINGQCKTPRRDSLTDIQLLGFGLQHQCPSA